MVVGDGEERNLVLSHGLVRIAEMIEIVVEYKLGNDRLFLKNEGGLKDTLVLINTMTEQP